MQRTEAWVWLALHRFGDAEARLADLTPRTDATLDWLLLSDAHMEQGELDAAEAALQRVLDRHPDVVSLDRAAHLAWLRGDLDRAVSLADQALSAGTEADPLPLAWALVKRGELRVALGEEPLEVGRALLLVPEHPRAHLVLGRWLLARGRPELAAGHLRRAGDTFAAAHALSFVDPTVDPADRATQDPRGYATWLAPTDPVAALALLELEYEARQDAITTIDLAWALHFAGRSTRARELARRAVDTGHPDSELLARAALVLDDATLLEAGARRIAGSWRAT